MLHVPLLLEVLRVPDKPCSSAVELLHPSSEQVRGLFPCAQPACSVSPIEAHACLQQHMLVRPACMQKDLGFRKLHQMPTAVWSRDPEGGQYMGQLQAILSVTPFGRRRMDK